MSKSRAEEIRQNVLRELEKVRQAEEAKKQAQIEARLAAKVKPIKEPKEPKSTIKVRTAEDLEYINEWQKKKNERIRTLGKRDCLIWFTLDNISKIDDEIAKSPNKIFRSDIVNLAITQYYANKDLRNE